MTGGFLLQAVVYLGAAVICVPVAKRLGMGSVLGYIAAGILIGPFVLGFVGSEGEDIMHFAEFGVVVMLFIIGLELEPARFWSMRKMIFGVGLSQMAFTAVALFLAGLALGLGWSGAIAAGLALAMSSTAIVLQTLKEQDQLGTPVGQFSFSVLLFQDIAVIPILAVIPLLAVAPVVSDGGHGVLPSLPGWVRALAVLGAVGLIILAGRFIVVPFLRLVAKTRLRELFIASALLLVVAIALLMEQVGLSPALGTFLAGVVLANSEFRHELESDLDPFKGLLLGLFFIAVGASINFALLTGQPERLIALTAGIVLIKGVILFLLARMNRLNSHDAVSFAVGLSQVGEFAFVLFALIGQVGILDGRWIDTFMAVTAMSMTITPVLILVNDRLVRPRIGVKPAAEREMDTIEEQNKVILAGFSHFGSTVGRFLRANGVEATILDSDASRVDLLRRMGFKVYFGDVTRMDLLETAGAGRAEILVVAIDAPETTIELVKTIRKHFPTLRLMVRAKNRFDAYELLDLGVSDIYRESLDTSVRLGVDVLRRLGHRGYSAVRAGQKFLQYDEEALIELASHRKDMKKYVSRVREQIALQEELLSEDMQHDPTTSDHAWDSDEMKDTVARG
ncbi:MAG: monovalent cation:proton antiporter-2 (CPA2) family protein [Ignavibacteria bacterium]|nr:monovalent cation:proton antiporter-2 (CPA2) family protein [Ignavibacteria bacterium]